MEQAFANILQSVALTTVSHIALCTATMMSRVLKALQERSLKRAGLKRKRFIVVICLGFKDSGLE